MPEEMLWECGWLQQDHRPSPHASLLALCLVEPCVKSGPHWRQRRLQDGGFMEYGLDGLAKNPDGPLPNDTPIG